MKKKLLYLLIALLCNFSITKASDIEISPYIAATNYWVPGTYLNGLMAVNGAIDTANFKFIRIGGFGANSYTNDQYITYIDQIRAIGAEPIVTVAASKSIATVTAMITYINVTKGRKIKYWSVGNEPDHANGGNLSVETVAAYTKSISTALKDVDSTIKVIGLEYSAYTTSSWVKLLGGTADITGKDANGNYYVDIISWHRYGIISVSDIQSNVTDMVARLNVVNKNRTDNPLQWMMGEINMHYDNSLVTNPDGYCWSFWSGQLFAGFWKMGIENKGFSYCQWSIAEGGSDRSSGDLGLFDALNKGRSIYYHSLMFNQNLKKYYALSSDNQTNVETLCMKDSTGVAVMITNANKDKSFTYSVRLDNTYGIGSNLKIKVDASIAKEVFGVIPAFATQMLVFDNNGIFVKLYTYTSLDADAQKGPSIIFPESECNAMPTVDSVSTVIHQSGTEDFKIKFTGITDGNGSSNNLSIVASSMDSTIAQVDSVLYNSSADSAIVYVKPLKKGITAIVLIISDQGATDCIKPAINISAVDVKIYDVIDIPALIEAEDYFNMYGLTTQTSTLGSLNMASSTKGDYLEYKINVPSPGTYYLTAGVSSASGYAALAVKEDTAVLGTFSVDNTGGWQVWKQKIVSLNFTTAGEHTLRIEYTSAGANLDYFIFSSIDPTSNNLPYTYLTLPINNTTVEETSSITLQASSYDPENKIKKVDFYADDFLIGSDTITPYSVDWKSIFVGAHKLKSVITDDAGNSTSSTIINITIVKSAAFQIIPGKIEAENYSTMYGIQTQATADVLGGGLNVGYMDTNDWVDYKCKVQETGVYKINARLAGWATGKYLELRDETGKVLTKINVPYTSIGTSGNDKYQIYADVLGDSTFTLNAGSKTLRIFSINGSVNFNYFSIENVGNSGSTSIIISPSTLSLKKGDFIELKANGTDTAGNSYDINPAWSCNFDGMINSFGVFLAKDTGTYIVTAKVGSIEGSLTILVSDTLTKHNLTLSVISNGTVVPNATVILNGLTGISNANGIVVFNSLSPANDYIYTVKATGFYDTLGFVSITDADVNKEIELRALPRYSVTFTVKENNVALENVTVTFSGSSKNTDANGMVVFENYLAATGLAYSTTFTGYTKVSGTISIVNANVSKDIALSKTISSIPSLNSSIKVYPNPVTDNLMVENAQNSILNVIDMSGKVILTKSISSANENINISNLSIGVYNIVIKMNNSNYSRLITKQ
jgi:hypothetical protein